MRRLPLVLLALAGCSRSSSSTTPNRATCAEAALGVDAALRSELGTTVLEEDYATFRMTSERRCAEDSWSADAITCVAAATSAAELDRCEAHLTEAQRDGLVAIVEGFMKGDFGGDR